MGAACDNPMLTAHYSVAELGLTDADERQVGCGRVLCQEVLEPMRSALGPQRVSSGYRPPAHNLEVGGKPGSFHLFNDGRCAVDLVPLNVSVGGAFDWLRLDSGLAFDKGILEFHPVEGDEDLRQLGILATRAVNGGLIAEILKEPGFEKLAARCLHVQLDIDNAPRRLAYIGFTGNSQVYKSVPVKAGPCTP